MSNFLNINWSDAGKAVVITFLTTFVGLIYQALQAVANGAAALPTLHDIGAWAIAGLVAAIGYLIKNVFTNSLGQFAQKEPPKQP